MVDGNPWVAPCEVGQQRAYLLAGTGIVDKKKPPIAGGPGKDALDTITRFLRRSVDRDYDIDAATPAQQLEWKQAAYRFQRAKADQEDDREQTIEL